MLITLFRNIGTLMLLLVWSLPGSAEPMVFASGAEGGGYWSAAKRLEDVASGMGLEVQVEESSGSLRNLARLLDQADPASLALVQADALQQYLNKHPGDSNKVEILENIGQECVFIVTSAASAIRTDKDLQKGKDIKLAINNPDSGAAVTYAFMTTLAPEMAGTSVLYLDTESVMGELQSADDAAADAVMLVHRPKEYSAEVDLALRNPDQFRFVEVTDERLKSELPDGQAIYRILKLAVPVPDSEEKRQVSTVCVMGLLVANKEKVLPDQRAALARLVNERWMSVYATER